MVSGLEKVVKQRVPAGSNKSPDSDSRLLEKLPPKLKTQPYCFTLGDAFLEGWSYMSCITQLFLT